MVGVVNTVFRPSHGRLGESGRQGHRKAMADSEDENAAATLPTVGGNAAPNLADSSDMASPRNRKLPVGVKRSSGELKSSDGTGTPSGTLRAMDTPDEPKDGIVKTGAFFGSKTRSRSLRGITN